MKWKLFKRIIYIIALAVLIPSACLLCEMTLVSAVDRWKDENIPLTPIPQTKIDDDYLILDPVSGVANSRIQKYMGKGYVVNQSGFRGEEIDLDVDEHWVFLGDSATFGMGVPVEITFPMLIQQEAHADNFDMRSVNAGLPNMGPAKEYLLLRKLLNAGSLKIKVVVVGFTSSDVKDDTVQSFVTKAQTNSLEISDYVDYMFNNLQGTHIYQFISATLDEFVGTKLPQRLDDKDLLAYLLLDDVEAMKKMPEWQFTLNNLLHMYKLAEENNIPLIVVNLPRSEKEIVTGESPIGSLLQEYTAQHNIPYLSSTDIYHEYFDTKGYFTGEGKSLPDTIYTIDHKGNKDIGHMGPLGQQLIADAIYAEIIRLRE